MTYRLPPLTTLRLFEAAARHLSFKTAAEELRVTPSAVSHGIQTLEEWLGVELFHRYNRRLVLTGAGATFLPQVQESLAALAKAAENLPGRKPSDKLSVSLAPTFASRWMAPHLPRFQALHPRIQVTIDTRLQKVEFPRDGIDVAIRMGRGPWDGLYALKLIDERLVPVCSPAMAAQIAVPEDLSRATLLEVVMASDDWESWFRLAGIPPVAGRQTVKFDTIHMALDAAAGGAGIAIGRLPLIRRDIETGTLVEVLGPPRPCDTGYWFLAARESLNRPEVAAFRDWIRAEIAENHD